MTIIFICDVQKRWRRQSMHLRTHPNISEGFEILVASWPVKFRSWTGPTNVINVLHSYSRLALEISQPELMREIEHVFLISPTMLRSHSSFEELMRLSDIQQNLPYIYCSLLVSFWELQHEWMRAREGNERTICTSWLESPWACILELYDRRPVQKHLEHERVFCNAIDIVHHIQHRSMN